MNRARQIIEEIASNMDDKQLKDIRYVLEDGEALASLGFTDDDQEVIEEAHFVITNWIKSGLETYGQVA